MLDKEIALFKLEQQQKIASKGQIPSRKEDLPKKADPPKKESSMGQIAQDLIQGIEERKVEVSEEKKISSPNKIVKIPSKKKLEALI